jgi:LDH2 family malate/lactate/ureidoglycolate dehydrogenase
VVAIYPKSDTDRRVSAVNLTRVIGAIFEKCGMSPADAALLTESLIHADLRGVHSHGVLRIPDYVKKLTRDGANPRGRPKVKSDRGAALVIDGDNAMGQIAGAFAMQKAIARAAEIGVAFAAVGGSNHCGAMDWYTLMAIERDMIGIAGTNAIPTMAPWGGLDRIVGINPLSIAMPAERSEPFMLDFAFGATAHGKIRVYHQKGSALPEGWAFDADGKPTTDAAAALVGLIQPIGQHKGVALGMAVGMLSTLLSGAGYGTESGTMESGARVGHDGHFFAAIDIAAFQDPAEFKRRVDTIIDHVHNSRRMPGVERLFVPGEIEFEIEAAHRRDGILLSGPTVDDIAAAAKSLDVDASPLFA